MALDNKDKVWIRDTIVEALEEVVLPRFDEHDKRFDVIEADISDLKDDVHILKQDIREVKVGLKDLDGRVEALEADIKEIYLMQARIEKMVVGDKQFAKLTLEKKLLKLNSELIATAKEAGIVLPR